MDLRNNRITVREVLANPKARELFQKEFPKAANSPLLQMAQNMTLQQVMQYARGYMPQSRMNELLERLKAL